MRTRILIGVVIAAGIVLGTGPTPARATQPDKAATAPKWEYKALTRDRIAEVGQKDFETGLNRLGQEGWELASFDGTLREYVFKRPQGVATISVMELKERLTKAQADLQLQQQRLDWTDRMVRRDYMSEQQLKAEQLRLESLKATLDQLRKELEALTPAGRDR